MDRILGLSSPNGGAIATSPLMEKKPIATMETEVKTKAKQKEKEKQDNPLSFLLQEYSDSEEEEEEELEEKLDQNKIEELLDEDIKEIDMEIDALPSLKKKDFDQELNEFFAEIEKVSQKPSKDGPHPPPSGDFKPPEPMPDELELKRILKPSNVVMKSNINIAKTSSLINKWQTVMTEKQNEISKPLPPLPPNESSNKLPSKYSEPSNSIMKLKEDVRISKTSLPKKSVKFDTMKEEQHEKVEEKIVNAAGFVTTPSKPKGQIEWRSKVSQLKKEGS